MKITYGGWFLLLLWWVWSLIFVYYIVTTYPIGRDWEPLFPNLNKDLYNRICMQIHFTGGVIVQILGPIQLIPWFRNRFKIHKWTGRVYLLGMIGACIGGELYMILNSTVGGPNMTAAFATYGALFFISGCITYYYARTRDFKKHKYWAILTFLLGIGSLIYRTLYRIMMLFGYSIQPFQSADWRRPLDMAFDWLFFLPSAVIGLIVIAILYRKNKRNGYQIVNSKNINIIYV